MKIKYLLCIIILLTIIFTNSVFAQKEAKKVNLIYNWQPGYSYNYKTTAIYPNSKIEDNQTIETIIEVLSRENDSTNFALRVPKLSKSTLFVSITNYGEINFRKFKKDFFIPDVCVDAKSGSFLMKALMPLNFFQQDFWIIPPGSFSVGEFTEFKGSRFLVRDFSPNSNIVNIEVIKNNLDGTSENTKHVRSFDVKRGILTKNRFSDKDGTIVTVKLENVTQLATNRYNELKEDFEAAIDEDVFRLEVCKPFIKNKNKMIKRTSYSNLLKVKNKEHLSNIYSDLFRESYNDQYFRIVLDNFLFDKIRSGEDWAIETFFNKNWELFEKSVYAPTHISMLEDLSGLELGKDKELWKKWFSQIKSVFPKIKNTESVELKKHIKHKEPWIRLFALKKLYTRRDEDIAKLLKDASVDQDETVKQYAIEMFKYVKQ